MKTIAFAGGGTGGHIFPVKALIENINKDRYQILWFGQKNSLEEKVANELKNQGYNLIFLPVLSGKIRRQLTLKAIYLNFIDIFKVLGGFFQSFYYVLKYKPEFIFSKGGFVAFNPPLAGKILGKKIYLHESDTIPGLVNKIVGKFATKVFLGFDYAKKYFLKEKTEVAGQILSKDLLNFAKEHSNLNVDNQKTNLLLIGGSQGAKVLIEALKNILDKGSLKDFNIYVVGGLLNKKNIFEKFDNVKFYEFLSQLELAKLYNLADISITRGAATSCAEQDLFNILKIVVPLPFTGGNHQYYNGIEYQKKGAFLLDQQDSDFKEKLEKLLSSLKGYKKSRNYNFENNVAKKILDEIL